MAEKFVLGKIRGESAFEAAQRNGFKGTEAEWLKSLKGKDGVVDNTVVKSEIETYMNEHPVKAGVDETVVSAKIESAISDKNLATKEDVTQSLKEYIDTHDFGSADVTELTEKIDNMFSTEESIELATPELLTGFINADGTITTPTWHHRIQVSCSNTKSVKISVASGLNKDVPFAVFTDKNDNVLSVIDYANQVRNTEYSFDTPDGAYYFYHNTVASNTEAFIIKVGKKITIVDKDDLSTNLKTELNQLQDAYLVLPNQQTELTLDKYISYDSGTVNTYSGCAISAEIDISNYNRIILQTVNKTSNDKRGYALYDANHKYISGMGYQNGVSDYTVDLPTNAKYIRFTVVKECQSDYSYTLVNALNNINKVLEDIESKVSRLTQITPIDDVPITSFVNSGFASCINSYVCIGDSLTQGVFNNTNNAKMDYEATGFYNYPSQLARITGATVHNLGWAGAVACDTEQAKTEGHSYLNTAEKKNWFANEYKGTAYIISLGTNDLGYYGEFTGDVDTDIDVDNYANNADTSVGGLATIIQKIKEQQPKAIIFVETIDNTRNRNLKTERTNANEKMRKVAEKFGCFVIDFEKYWIQDSEVTAWLETYQNGGHLNAMGYLVKTQARVQYIDWLVKHNPSAFYNVQFVGSDADFVR